MIPPDNAINYKLGNLKETKFTFSHVFDTLSRQDDVYKTVAQPLVESLIKGENGLLFTYGVTGSGKTFTMTGNLKSKGIMPRCLDSLFKTISKYKSPKFTFKADKMNGFEILSEKDIQLENDKFEKPFYKTNPKPFHHNVLNEEGNDVVNLQGIDENNIYSVFITYVEVYNNCVYDLLEDNISPNRGTLQSRVIREDAQHNMYVHGVTELEVNSVEEAIQIFNRGQKRRTNAYTMLNAESSRSHSVFTIRLVQAPAVSVTNKTQNNNIIISQLSLVDLAGSERLSRTNNTGQRLKEAGNINNSLMTLRTCLELLRESQMYGCSKKIPYRDSKLTNLFKKYFDGHGFVRMIVCVNPSVDDYDENLQVMKFAEMAQDVQIIKPVSLKFYDNKHTPKVQKYTWNNIDLAKENVPNLIISSPSSRATINDLCNYLTGKIKKRQMIASNLNNLMGYFRENLMESNKRYNELSLELSTTKSILRKDEIKIKNSNNRLKLHDNCLGKTMEYIKKIEMESLTLKSRRESQKNYYEQKKENLRNKKRLLLSEHLNENLKNSQKNKDLQPGALNENKSAEQEEFRHKTVNRMSPNTAINSKYRRSKSAERWVEHRAKDIIPLGTIFQPFYKSRKSVNRLDESDLKSNKTSNYCLVDQQMGKSGEVETKLYKGEILPSSAGGAQVIFSDVECLTQLSPCSKAK